MFHKTPGGTDPAKAIEMKSAVSIAWDTIVEALFRNHR